MEKWELGLFGFYNKLGLNIWEITFIDLLYSNDVTLEKVNDDPNHRGWYYLKRDGISRNRYPVIRNAVGACEWFDTYIGEVLETLVDAATDNEIFLPSHIVTEVPCEDGSALMRITEQWECDYWAELLTRRNSKQYALHQNFFTMYEGEMMICALAAHHTSDVNLEKIAEYYNALKEKK